MDIRNRSVEALILKAQDYREQDRLLTIVSAEYGPERVIARGAKKSAGSLRSLAQPMSRANLVLTPAKGGLCFLSEGVPEESYFALTDPLSRYAYAAYCSELLLSAWPAGGIQPALYALLLATLSLLKLDEHPERTARFFELRLLQILGLLPLLGTRCAQCGREAQGRRFLLSPQKGALLCTACGAEDASPGLSAGAVASMEQLCKLPLSRIPSLRLSPAISAELERALAFYLDYHLEHAPQARRALKELTE